MARPDRTVGLDVEALRAEIDRLKARIAEQIGAPPDNWEYAELLARRLGRYKAVMQKIRRFEHLIAAQQRVSSPAPARSSRA